MIRSTLRLSALIALLVTLALSCAACDSTDTGTTSTASASSAPAPTATPAKPTPTTPPPTPTPTPKWTVVQSFPGNGISKTPTFTVPDHWRLLWSCDPTSFDGLHYNVMANVNTPDGQTLDVAAVNTLCANGNDHGSTDEYQGGTVYLDINSEAAWTFKIEVLK